MTAGPQQRVFGLCAMVVAATLVTGPAGAEWQADSDDRRQVKAARAIASIRDRIPASQSYLEDAYGFAILPSVTRLGFGFGGAYGRGLVVEADAVIGTTGYWQFTSGIQAGARNFSMIILFRDKAALEEYKAGKTQFMGQAGLALANVGVAGTPAYNDGVAIFTVTRLGIMGEFTVSGAKFTFKPLAEVNTAD